MDHEQDDEECDEADTEHQFEIGIAEYRNGASVFASVSVAVQPRSRFSKRIGVDIGEGFGSAPNGASSSSGHSWWIRDSPHRMRRILELKVFV